MNNKPVAWMYRVNNSFNTFSTIEPPDDAYDEGTLVPLYTQEALEEARKLGMQQERALWNLAESTQEIMNPYKAITDTKIKPTVVSYTHPVKELTDEEILKIADDPDLCNYDGSLRSCIDFARAILRKAQEK